MARLKTVAEPALRCKGVGGMKYSHIVKSAAKHLWSGFKLPYMVMFETTLMCNMFCEYCIFGEEGKFNDLQTRATRDRIFKRIDEFCEMGIFALSFSGGEPLLNPSTCDYIAYAADKGMWTSMPTNGLLIKKYAEGVARLDMLEVSIDSLNVQRFAKRRGVDGLPRIIENLDFVLAKRRPFTTQINAAVNIENLDDLPELAEFCKQRHLVMHPEAVHNVMRDGELLPDAELHGKDLDKVEMFSARTAHVLSEERPLLYSLLRLLSHGRIRAQVSLPASFQAHLHEARWLHPLALRVRNPAQVAGALEGNFRLGSGEENHRPGSNFVGLLQGV